MYIYIHIQGLDVSIRLQIFMYMYGVVASNLHHGSCPAWGCDHPRGYTLGQRSANGGIPVTPIAVD